VNEDDQKVNSARTTHKEMDWLKWWKTDIKGTLMTSEDRHRDTV